MKKLLRSWKFYFIMAAVPVGLYLLYYFGYTLLFILLLAISYSSDPSRRLSWQEKSFVKELKEKCDCNVRVEHDDSTKAIGFHWKTGIGIKEGEYNKGNDLCFRDSGFLVPHAIYAARGIVKRMDHKKPCNRVVVYYSTERKFDERGSSSICWSMVGFELKKNGILKLRDFTQRNH